MQQKFRKQTPAPGSSERRRCTPIQTIHQEREKNKVSLIHFDIFIFITQDRSLMFLFSLEVSFRCQSEVIFIVSFVSLVELKLIHLSVRL